jgi:hypothetical protein
VTSDRLAALLTYAVLGWVLGAGLECLVSGQAVLVAPARVAAVASAAARLVLSPLFFGAALGLLAAVLAARLLIPWYTLVSLTVRRPAPSARAASRIHGTRR